MSTNQRTFKPEYLIQQKPEDLMPELKTLKDNYQAMETALKAINARISGEWDNPALASLGELDTNTEVDIKRITKETLQKIKITN
jgi:hypothetical protein